jgi:hypothetical protein
MFHTDFHRTFKPETLFNVRFRFNRMPMRLRHRSIDNIDMDLFWPTSIPEHVVSLQMVNIKCGILMLLLAEEIFR